MHSTVLRALKCAIKHAAQSSLLQADAQRGSAWCSAVSPALLAWRASPPLDGTAAQPRTFAQLFPGRHMHIDGAQGCAESAEPGANGAAQPASMLGKAPLGQICRQFQARIVTDAALLHQTLHAGRHARNRASDHYLHVWQIDPARGYHVCHVLANRVQTAMQLPLCPCS